MPDSQQLSQWWKRGKGLRWGMGAGVRLALLMLLAATVAFTVGDAPPAAASRVPDQEEGKSYTAAGSGSVYDPSTGKLIAVNHTTTVATRAEPG